MNSIIKHQKMLEQVPDYESIINGQEKFTDSQFPPNFDSIFSSKQTKFVWNKSKYHCKQTKKQYKAEVGWIRLSELFGLNDMTLIEDVSPKDVQQGALGDCYLMSMLGTTANRWPEQIEGLFTTKKANSNGCYALRLMYNGHYSTMVIDDYVPYDIKTKKLIYAKKVTKNIWPILLEKAYAKFNGSYENIESGYTLEIKFFLPFPLPQERREYQKNERSEKWKMMKSKLDENCALT